MSLRSSELAIIALAVFLLGGCAGLVQTPAGDVDDVKDLKDVKDVQDVQGPVADLAAKNQFETAIAAARAGDLASAEAAFAELTRTHPEYVSPWINLGLIHVKAGRNDDAMQAYLHALEIGSSHCDALNQLGTLARELRDFDVAESIYRTCLELEPEHAATLLNLGILYELYMGRLPESLAAYQKYQGITADQRVSGWIVDLTRRIESSQLAVGGVTR